MDETILQLKERIFGKKTGLFPEEMIDEIRNDTVPDIFFKQFPKNISTGRFSLEEVLEIIEKQKKEEIMIVKDRTKDSFDLKEPWLLLDQELVEKKEPEIILYEISDGKYFVYKKKKTEDFKSEIKPKYSPGDLLLSGEDSRINSLYLPTGIIVEVVPQYVLGDNVLGRAFVYQNRIQILNTLSGNDYHEVLTHEMFHIKHPEMSETNIRLMTRNYVGENARYH